MAHYGCNSPLNRIVESIRKMVETIELAGGQSDCAVPMVIGILIEILANMYKDQLDLERVIRELKDIRGTVSRFAFDAHGIGKQLDTVIEKLGREMHPYKDDAWEKIFGHCWYLKGEFSSYNFGKKQDPEDQAEEFDFDRPITGLEAMEEFKKMDRVLASIWAQGRYINLHPEATRHNSLAGIGARWETSNYGPLFPAYRLNGPGIEIKLYSIHVPLDKPFKFLIRKQ